MKQKIYTTGQAARIVGVAPRTIAKAFDSGQLKGYRIPTGRDRRIPHPSLVEWMRSNGIPLGSLESDVCYRVLLVGCSEFLTSKLQTSLYRDRGYIIDVAHNGFEAGVFASDRPPSFVVIDLSIGLSEGVVIATYLRAMQPSGLTIIAIAGEDGTPSIVKEAFDVALQSPFNSSEIVDMIQADATLKWGHV